MNATAVAIAVHGGAGAPRRTPTPEEERDARRALVAAVAAAADALNTGGSALDAAQAAVALLEDCGLFNAGRGSVPTSAGGIEMDAALMCGPGRRLGAVAAVAGVRNPIALARVVLEATPHVLLVGEGAERLAEEHGLPRPESGWFRRAGAAAPETGTVGAVVRDAAGRLAAATSTGGMRGQRPGRVGDSPLPGAGTLADGALAVSATGHGEAIARAVLAHEVGALVRLAGFDLAAAASRALGQVGHLGAAAGLIAVGATGAPVLACTAPVMYRAVRVEDGPVRTAIGRDDPLAEIS